MRIHARWLSVALALCVANAPDARAAPTIDTATISITIDARKASGHPWHGPGDLIISAPIKHVPTPITKLPEAPGAVLCIVRSDESIDCPGVLDRSAGNQPDAQPAPVGQDDLPDAVEQFYKQLQVHDFRGAPSRAYRDASQRLFARVVAPDAFCDPPRCPGDKRFVGQTVDRIRAEAAQGPQHDQAVAEDASDPTPSTTDAQDARPRLQSPCPTSFDCEFYDIALPPDEVFGLLFIDPAMVFTNLIDGVVITRAPIRRGDARLKRMDEALRRAAATLAPPGPWEAKRRLRAFPVRGIEDCVAAKCRGTQSDFKLEPEASR